MSGITVSYRRKNIPDPIPLPKDHQHESDVGFPVLGFDFNRTLTPSMEYPIETGPFPGVKAVLDTFKARGCCLHIMTSGLFYGTHEIPVFLSRQRQLYEWCNRYEIPIDFAGGKVPSDCYYDNDAVNVPLVEKPDWDLIAAGIEAKLASRFNLVKGKYVPTPHAPIGIPMPDPVPPTEPLPPRGYSAVRLDVDFHKTLFPASSSQRYSPPDEVGLGIVNAFYKSGYTIRLSCAGWSPLTHPQAESDERYQGLVWQCAEYSVLYDRIVTKDFHHVITDDKAIPADGDWEGDVPKIRAMLARDSRRSPDLMWPA